MRTRQPLRRALVASAAWEQLGEDLRAQVCEELNVGSLESLADAAGDLVDHTAKGNFRNLGKRFGKQTPQVAAAIAAANAAALAVDLSAHSVSSVDVAGTSVEVGPEDVIISERPREGWSVVNDQGETVALDLELDDELRSAGLARVAIRDQKKSRFSPRKANLITGRKRTADVAAARKPSPMVLHRRPRRRPSSSATPNANGTSRGTMRNDRYVDSPMPIAAPAASTDPRSPRRWYRRTAQSTSAVSGIG